MKTKLFIYLGISLWLFSSCQESANELQELETGIENKVYKRNKKYLFVKP